MKRRIILFILLLAAIGGGVYYYMMQQSQPIVLTGIVTTDDWIVSAQIQGRLEKLNVDRGDIVKKGDLLATIEPGTQMADMTYFEQAAKQAEMEVSGAEADLRFEEAQTESQIIQAQANEAAAAAQVAQARADLDNAKLNFQREEEAYKHGAESPQMYDQARTSFAAQQAKVDAAVKQEEASAAAINVAKSSLEQVASRRAALDTSRHQLEGAAAQQDKAKVQLGYTEIKAPIDGIVDIRAALQGEVVNPGQAIVTLIDPDGLWVRADIEETYVDRVHIGDQLMVRLPSGKERPGTVFYRGVDADYATQRDVSRTKRDIKTFEIRIRCDNHDRALALGMTAYVTLPAIIAAPPPASTTSTQPATSAP